MAKGSNSRKSNKKTPQKPLPDFSDSDLDDDIDVFHKQRDVVPLDLDNDVGDSDEDNDQHVFELEDDSDDDEDEDEDDSEEDTGFAAKIAKQQKSLKAKLGGAEDETQDDVEDDERKPIAWGRGKNIYYGRDTGDSSEEEQEEEIRRQLTEKEKKYSNADLGLEDDSEEEPTFENLSKGKGRSKATVGHDAQDETDTEVVTKDPNALSKEEQMDVVYNSAPELVGLLSELSEAVDQLETKIDPIISKLKEVKSINKNGVQYMEVKKQLLLSYCQAISFYLLLKSEGHPVRDHPVLARIVEIKNLLDKMKTLDENLASDVEDFLKNHATAKTEDSPMEIEAVESISLINDSSTTETQKESPVVPKTDSTLDLDNGGKRKPGSEKIGLQSAEMLKVRAALEEKLKQKGVFNLKATQTDGVKKNSKPLNGKLETRDDFDDDTFDIEGNQNKSLNKLSQLVTQKKKPRVVSGDDDLPTRDDIGERRRKHEMRVLTNAGIHSDDDDLQENERETSEVDEDGETEDGDSDSESDLYEQTKLKRDAKLAAKSQKYSRTTPSDVAAPETQLDGKRHINYEMEKNRGLTRKRNKDLKNPRKKYKLKHKKKEVARKGQVRDIRKPAGPYGGEASGINTISKSIRFKS
ncbi:putative sas10 domain-containing protein [Helianthus annuus]|uniref:Putative sas10/U3 ribonucleoprotein (Utp) family protein n=1 Tax=Helianthus annuus TaxID=4232 RepID=A0A251SGC7_HELAN|nr:something about silencing protein 10 [Helianthus annuus]KAF5768794.1 putative sas10 domain-containing protein [Helianthus annuus]KAJ0463960.1 putative sas10 domain-containing protein [Helianthus annuus]KAJ0468305.1 putative sas10 domain-containing protein [Helianthus annuus]KAJ0485459.1 putative sas10 domain-containing protein [Helianthus annuus]KAJ0656012.1 putative sas10 domain-containing protein [Helianthus annuus]